MGDRNRRSTRKCQWRWRPPVPMTGSSVARLGMIDPTHSVCTYRPINLDRRLLTSGKRSSFCRNRDIDTLSADCSGESEKRSDELHGEVEECLLSENRDTRVHFIPQSQEQGIILEFYDAGQHLFQRKTLSAFCGCGCEQGGARNAFSALVRINWEVSADRHRGAFAMKSWTSLQNA